MAASPGSTHGPTGWFRRSASAAARSPWRRARARCGWPMRAVTRSWRSTLAAGYPAGPFGWRILRAGWRSGSARCGSPSRWRTNWSGSIRSAERSWPRSGSAPAPGRSRRRGGAVWVVNALDGTLSRVDPDAQRRRLDRAGRGRADRGRSRRGRRLGYRRRRRGAGVGGSRTGTVRRRDTVGAAPAAVTLLGQTPWVAAGAPAGREHRGGTLRVEYSAIQVLDPADSIRRAPRDLAGDRRRAGGAGTDLRRGATGPRPRHRGAGAHRRRAHLRLPPPARNPLLDRRAGPSLRPTPRVRAAIRHQQPGRPLLLGPAGSGGMHAAARCLRPVARGHHRRPDRHHHPPPDPPRPGPAVQADTASGAAGAARNAPRASWPPGRSPPPGPTGSPSSSPAGGCCSSATSVSASGPGRPSPTATPTASTSGWTTDPSQRVQAVLRGHADLALEIASTNLAPLRTRFASQLRLDTQPDTSFLTFNVRRPPFSNVLARRAVNLAIDRAAVTRHLGGPGQSIPTCQVLPPHFPGLPGLLPLDPPPARRTLARAGHRTRPGAGPRVGNRRGDRRLHPPQQRPHRHRGDRRARLRPARDRLPPAGDQRRRPVLPAPGQTRTDDGTSATASGSPTIPRPANSSTYFLSCANYHPDDPARTTNGGGFCNARFDRLVRQAETLQLTNPAAAQDIWARADRLAVDQAAWVPLANTGVPNCSPAGLVTSPSTPMASRRSTSSGCGKHAVSGPVPQHGEHNTSGQPEGILTCLLTTASSKGPSPR